MEGLELIEEVNRLRARELETKLRDAREAYYNGTPIVEDAAYDAWLDELKDLDVSSPEAKAVGALPVSSWPKVRHTIPMGSLDKVQTADEMVEWVKAALAKLPGEDPVHLQFVGIDKLDGISVSLRYEAGKLVQALTRGDGEVGEDITPNVLRMKGVLAELPRPENVTFRGEIVLHKDDHKTHFPETSNPRNTASGTSKRYDGRGCEHLTVYLYQALDTEETLTDEWVQYLYIKKLGLRTPKFSAPLDAKSIVLLWNDYQKGLRDQLPYDIDGLVIRLATTSLQLSLGDKDGRPRGAVAFKFPPAAKQTVARKRLDQVGGTGRITPVAEFDTVNLVGAEVSRASLYNQKYVEQIGFDVGAEILVSRANDVIPRVVSVLKGTGTVSPAPTHCPECGAETARDGEYVICPNTSECPAQTTGRIQQWVRDLGILEWGSVLIEKVVAAGFVKTVPDLYRLTEEQLAGLGRMGESSAKRAREELWKLNPLPLERILGALSIPLCATSTMQVLVDAGFDTIDKLRVATAAQLQAVPSMGPKRAEAFVAWMAQHGGVFEDLLSTGVTLKDRPKGSLTGKSVCFTGKSSKPRAELERLASEAGGTVKNSVGKGLTYLVIADPNSSSSKAQAARKNGTELLSEEAYLQLVQS